VSVEPAGWPAAWIVPDWPAPAGVHAVMSTRAGGVSSAPFGAGPGRAEGMNLGLGSGDAPAQVLANRALLRAQLPAEPCWMEQVHGSAVVDADAAWSAPPQADASTALQAGRVCAVLVADCLPVLFCERHGRGVAGAHAGWRGLAAGVLQNTASRLRERLRRECGVAAAELIAWLGPAIGPQRFEVGPEVRAAMRARLARADEAFAPQPGGKYLADLFSLARLALAECGVHAVYGGGLCTASDPQRFYSYRRDGRTGRHAALVWRTSPAQGTGR
jgi:YfiH family protein